MLLKLRSRDSRMSFLCIIMFYFSVPAAIIVLIQWPATLRSFLQFASHCILMILHGTLQQSAVIAWSKMTVRCKLWRFRRFLVDWSSRIYFYCFSQRKHHRFSCSLGMWRFRRIWTYWYYRSFLLFIQFLLNCFHIFEHRRLLFRALRSLENHSRLS